MCPEEAQTLCYHHNLFTAAGPQQGSVIHASVRLTSAASCAHTTAGARVDAAPNKLQPRRCSRYSSSCLPVFCLPSPVAQARPRSQLTHHATLSQSWTTPLLLDKGQDQSQPGGLLQAHAPLCCRNFLWTRLVGQTAGRRSAAAHRPACAASSMLVLSANLRWAREGGGWQPLQQPIWARQVQTSKSSRSELADRLLICWPSPCTTTSASTTGRRP